MRKLSIAIALIAGLFSLPAQAANFTAKDAAAATIIFVNPGNCTTGCTPIFAWSDSTGANLVAVLTAGADAASNTANGGIVYNRNMIYNGTTWDRWQGAIKAASGAYAAGSLAAGAGVDGWDLTQGAIADAAVTAGATGSVSAKLRSISRDVMTTNTWGGGTLGAMANYGTSPGAVLVPGVNAFVTNSNANGRAVVANSSPVVPVAAASTVGNIAANNTTAVVVKASAGTLFGVQLGGIGSAPAYLKIYNAASATCGSGTPVKRLIIPAASTAANGAGSNISFGAGLAFGTGITYCITTGIGDADTTAPAASTFLVNLDYE